MDAKTGQPASPLQCIVRYLGYFVSALPLGLGFIWVAFDKRKQGWHDKIARTLVVGSARPTPYLAAKRGTLVVAGGLALRVMQPLT